MSYHGMFSQTHFCECKHTHINIQTHMQSTHKNTNMHAHNHALDLDLEMVPNLLVLHTKHQGTAAMARTRNSTQSASSTEDC